MEIDWKKDIASTFTEQSDVILSDIMVKFNLEETNEQLRQKEKDGKMYNEVIITALTMAVFNKRIKDSELAGLLQKELNISEQQAQEVKKEILERIIPSLPKDDIGENEIEIAKAPKEDFDIFPKISPFESVSQPAQEKMSPVIPPVTPTKRKTAVKKSAVLQNERSEREEIKKPTTQIKQTSGPDKYRESIE